MSFQSYIYIPSLEPYVIKPHSDSADWDISDKSAKYDVETPVRCRVVKWFISVNTQCSKKAYQHKANMKGL